VQTRQKVKRQLLDQLDTLHAFELPPKMVEQEFDNIWRQIVAEMGQQGRTFESENTTEEAARADYHKIAERRVRLGLVLSEIGERTKIEVTEPEVQRALQAQLRQFPGREKQLVDYYRANPDAIASLRAPIFEEKVVDHILEQVKVTDKTVTAEELMKEDEDEAATTTAAV
jgi:trigger factor